MILPVLKTCKGDGKRIRKGGKKVLVELSVCACVRGFVCHSRTMGLSRSEKGSVSSAVWNQLPIEETSQHISRHCSVCVCVCVRIWGQAFSLSHSLTHTLTLSHTHEVQPPIWHLTISGFLTHGKVWVWSRKLHKILKLESTLI